MKDSSESSESTSSCERREFRAKAFKQMKKHLTKEEWKAKKQWFKDMKNKMSEE